MLALHFAHIGQGADINNLIIMHFQVHCTNAKDLIACIKLVQNHVGPSVWGDFWA